MLLCLHARTCNVIDLVWSPEQVGHCPALVGPPLTEVLLQGSKLQEGTQGSGVQGNTQLCKTPVALNRATSVSIC